MAQFTTTAGIDVSKAWLDIALGPDETVTLHIELAQPIAITNWPPG